MGLYLSEAKRIIYRSCNSIFYDKDGAFCHFFNRRKEIIFPINNVERIKNYQAILDIVSSRNINTFEFYLLNDLTNEEIEQVLKLFDNYIFERDMSIGILSRNDNFIKEHKTLLDEYGVNYVDRDEVIKSFNDYSSQEITYKPLDRCETAIVPRGRAPKKSSSMYNIITNANASIEENPATSFRTLKLQNKKLPDLDLAPSFNDTLIYFLNRSNKTNAEVYKRGMMSKQAFSRILSGQVEVPLRTTIMCLIIGLELSIEDGNKLLLSAGYQFSHSITLDKIVMKHMLEGDYSVIRINWELGAHGCPILGEKSKTKKREE